MLILIGRILVVAVFASMLIGLTCYAIAKTRENHPSQKSINKQIEKQTKLYEKQAQKEAEVEAQNTNINKATEIETIKEVVVNKNNIIEYGNGAFKVNNPAWKEYVKKLIIGGHLEETKNAEDFSVLNIVSADKSEKLRFVGDLKDIKDILTTNGSVNDGIKAPFEINDLAIVAKDGSVNEKFVFTENGLTKVITKAYAASMDMEIEDK